MTTNHRHAGISLALATIITSAAPQAGAAVTILGNLADNSINNDPATRNVNSVDEIVKSGVNNPNARNVVFVFQLPTLGAGQNFNSSTLSFTLLQNGATQVANASFTAGTTPGFNLDLYGLGARATSTVATGDIYFGATADTTDATLLQADFITPTTGVGTVSFTGATLDNYLTAQYAAGAGAGQFVFLRLNPDAPAGSDSSNTQNYRVSMANNTGTTSYSKIVPQIVPEPGSFALLGLGCILAATRRRRA